MKNPSGTILTKNEYGALSDMAQHIILQRRLQYPVNAYRLAAAYQVPVISYHDYAKRSGISIAQICASISERGFCFCSGGRNWIVCNRRMQSRGTICWTITHELMHILQGDHQSSDAMRDATEHRKREVAADFLTRRVLAPMCLLYLADVRSIDEVMTITGLSFEAARYAMREYQRFRARHRFGQSARERDVMEILSEQDELFRDKIHVW